MNTDLLERISTRARQLCDMLEADISIEGDDLFDLNNEVFKKMLVEYLGDKDIANTIDKSIVERDYVSKEKLKDIILKLWAKHGGCVECDANINDVELLKELGLEEEKRMEKKR